RSLPATAAQRRRDVPARPVLDRQSQLAGGEGDSPGPFASAAPFGSPGPFASPAPFASPPPFGKVNANMLPFPGWLSIRIWPPLRDRNSLHSINPRPVPVSPPVPRVE